MSNRKRLLVDPTVQWAIARRIMMHWVLLLACLITITALVRILVSAGNQGYVEAIKAAVYSQGPVVMVMVILLPIFLRDTLKLSNRFAGPMFRLRKVLGDMATGGDGYQINFRDGDYWAEAASEFNTVLDQVNDLKARNEALEAELAEARQTV